MQKKTKDILIIRFINGTQLHTPPVNNGSYLRLTRLFKKRIDRPMTYFRYSLLKKVLPFEEFFLTKNLDRVRHLQACAHPELTLAPIKLRHKIKIKSVKQISRVQ